MMLSLRSAPQAQPPDVPNAPWAPDGQRKFMSCGLGFLWVYMGFSAFLWVSTGFYWFLWVPMGFYELFEIYNNIILVYAYKQSISSGINMVSEGLWWFMPLKMDSLWCKKNRTRCFCSMKFICFPVRVHWESGKYQLDLGWSASCWHGTSSFTWRLLHVATS